jgi:hypothetical protein
MSDDFRVPSKWNVEVRQAAKQARKYFGVESNRRVDVLECAKRSKIWTVNGERDLVFKVLSDAEIPNASGLTTEINGQITISVPRSVHYDAYMGVGRARNTISHELGHAALGHAAFVKGTALARRPITNETPAWIRPFESAEHQAKVFAPAFLINEAIAETLASPQEIAVEFGISLESATIYFEQLTERQGRQESAQRVSRMAEQVREILNPKPPEVRFIDEPCPICAQRTLMPVGTKYLCKTCDSVSDRFQDGDLTAG